MSSPVCARRDLRVPAAVLGSRYRSAGVAEEGVHLRPDEVRAYLAARLPATFAAARRVLSELSRLRPDWAPTSLLDLGAGPGTATFAAAAAFGTLERVELVERDAGMAALGARLFGDVDVPPFAGAAWTIGDERERQGPRSDLVVAAYVLGELGRGRAQEALERWWRATVGALVLIEPGTPAGFERLRDARTSLIGWGAKVTAPCPHDAECPMQGGANWCHFAVRLACTSLHRDVKGARLGYEDEKYSFLVVSPDPPPPAAPRVVRSPRAHKGHVRVWLCEPDGLHERVISRRDGELYRSARTARWGDRLEAGRPPT